MTVEKMIYVLHSNTGYNYEATNVLLYLSVLYFIYLKTYKKWEKKEATLQYEFLNEISDFLS